MNQQLQFVKKGCAECQNEFETNNDSDKCYNCTLEEITGGWAPEEGDFNTAAILSGAMTEKQRQGLQQDLEAVETGVSRMEPMERDWSSSNDDPARCDGCNQDIAFCECVCYVCYEQLEDCKCTCAQCDIKVAGGGLCETHEESWNEEVQGPTPDEEQQIGNCANCGTPFNKAFLLNAPHSPHMQRTAYITERTLCIKCDTEGTGTYLT